MPSLPEPAALTGLDHALRALASSAAHAEEALFSVLPVLGDADLQRAVDHWVDQAVDTTRALAAAAAEETVRLAILTDRAGPADPADPAARDDRATRADRADPAARAGLSAVEAAFVAPDPRSAG